MQTDKKPYQHSPTNGLPRSLTQLEGETVAVIALMQRQAGLNRKQNRKHRRELQAGAKSYGELAPSIARITSKPNWNVLTFYLSTGERWGSFWHVVRTMLRRQIAVGTRSYAVAVDVQLLDAYDREWFKLSLDADVLTAACREWPRIREALERFWKGGKEPMPLSMFILWPRLLEDCSAGTSWAVTSCYGSAMRSSLFSPSAGHVGSSTKRCLGVRTSSRSSVNCRVLQGTRQAPRRQRQVNRIHRLARTRFRAKAR